MRSFTLALLAGSDDAPAAKKKAANCIASPMSPAIFNRPLRNADMPISFPSRIAMQSSPAIDSVTFASDT